MKKIISAVLAVAAVSAMSAPAFAVLTPDGEPVIQGDIMLLSEGVETGDVVAGEGDAETPIIILPGQTETAAPAYSKNEITVTAVEDADFDGATYENGLVSYEDGSVRLTGTVIFDVNGELKATEDIKVGDIIVTFANIYKDTDIPDYAVIMDEETLTGVTVDEFTASETLGDYVDTQNFLAINIAEDTEIVDVEGNELTEEDITDKYLMVFYNAMTMSIPAIANPSKVIVLGDVVKVEDPTEEATPEPTEEPAVEYEYEISVNWEDIIEQDGVKLVPVRKYAESVDLEVAWNGEDMSVTIGTIPMGVSFKIGENSYSKARMTPFTLEIAPQLINDTTYVPVSFFEQVLEAKVDIAE